MLSPTSTTPNNMQYNKKSGHVISYDYASLIALLTNSHTATLYTRHNNKLNLLLNHIITNNGIYFVEFDEVVIVIDNVLNNITNGGNMPDNSKLCMMQYINTIIQYTLVHSMRSSINVYELYTYKQQYIDYMKLLAKYVIPTQHSTILTNLTYCMQQYVTQHIQFNMYNSAEQQLYTDIIIHSKLLNCITGNLANIQPNNDIQYITSLTNTLYAATHINKLIDALVDECDIIDVSIQLIQQNSVVDTVLYILYNVVQQYTNTQSIASKLLHCDSIHTINTLINDSLNTMNNPQLIDCTRINDILVMSISLIKSINGNNVYMKYVSRTDILHTLTKQFIGMTTQRNPTIRFGTEYIKLYCIVLQLVCSNRHCTIQLAQYNIIQYLIQYLSPHTTQLPYTYIEYCELQSSVLYTIPFITRSYTRQYHQSSTTAVLLLYIEQISAAAHKDTLNTQLLCQLRDLCVSTLYQCIVYEIKYKSYQNIITDQRDTQLCEVTIRMMYKLITSNPANYTLLHSCYSIINQLIRADYINHTICHTYWHTFNIVELLLNQLCNTQSLITIIAHESRLIHTLLCTVQYSICYSSHTIQCAYIQLLGIHYLCNLLVLLPNTMSIQHQLVLNIINSLLSASNTHDSLHQLIQWSYDGNHQLLIQHQQLFTNDELQQYKQNIDIVVLLCTLWCTSSYVKQLHDIMHHANHTVTVDGANNIVLSIYILYKLIESHIDKTKLTHQQLIVLNQISNLKHILIGHAYINVNNQLNHMNLLSYDNNHIQQQLQQYEILLNTMKQYEVEQQNAIQHEQHTELHVYYNSILNRKLAIENQFHSNVYTKTSVFNNTHKHIFNTNKLMV